MSPPPPSGERSPGPVPVWVDSAIPVRGHMPQDFSAIPVRGHMPQDFSAIPVRGHVASVRSPGLYSRLYITSSIHTDYPASSVPNFKYPPPMSKFQVPKFPHGALNVFTKFTQRRILCAAQDFVCCAEFFCLLRRILRAAQVFVCVCCTASFIGVAQDLINLRQSLFLTPLSNDLQIKWTMAQITHCPAAPLRSIMLL